MLFKNQQNAENTNQETVETQAAPVAVVPQNGGVPAKAETGGGDLVSVEEMNAMFSPDDNMIGTEPRLPSAKILSQGAMFELPDGENAKAIEGVVIDSNRVNAYWESSYDETGGGVLPDCASYDDMKPKAEHPVSQSCITCPMNKYGSDGGRGKACKNMRRVHILVNGDRIPTRITLPPTSLKAWDEYMVLLRNKDIPYPAMITRIELTKQKNKDGIGYAEAKFIPVEQIASRERLLYIVKIKKMMLEQMQREEIIADEFSAPPSDPADQADSNAEHY